MHHALLILALGWRAFGDAALQQARREEKAVLLVVESRSCAACRVRQRAVFADPETAELVDRHFVCVRLDEDERPDAADAYLQAASLLGASGGSPLFLLLTREGWPFFAAIEDAERVDAASLRDTLARHADAYRDDRASVETKAGLTLAALRESQKGEMPLGPLGPELVAHAVKGLRDAAGALELRPAALRLLLEEHARTGDAESLRLATRTLDTLARDGTIPERLDERALRLRALAQAYATAGRAEHRAAAEQLVAATVRELRDPDGAFRNALGEADSARVQAGSNGLMIGALATSGALLGRKADVEAASLAATRIVESLGPPGALRRCAGCGNALLEDYAYLAEGILDLHDATRDEHWRNAAVALADAALARFLDVERGGFFSTDAAQPVALVRVRNGYDGALPSPNGVMASVLLRLSRATGEKRYAELARRTVEAFLGELQRAPRGMETLAAAAGELLGRPDRSEARVHADAASSPRSVRGPVVAEASLSSRTARPGQLLEARVEIQIAKPWCVPAHAPLDKSLSGLALSVPGDTVTPLLPRYPRGTAVKGGSARDIAAVHFEAAEVVVPVRVPRGAQPGSRLLRLLLRYQTCDERDCKKPESVVLELPFSVTP
jgi:uncharacterized protein YyaL (SSP411 family)